MDLFQAAAILPEWATHLACFDLETTGIDTRTSRIVSACVAVIDEEGDTVWRKDWLADPGVPIPEQAAAVHGITTEKAQAEGREASLVVSEIVSTLRELFTAGKPVVVYNAPYDLSLLYHEARRHGIDPIDQPGPVIDPLVIDKELDRYRKGKRTLSVAAGHYHVQLDNAHDAAADALAAAKVAQALARTYPDELSKAPQDIHADQVLWAKRQDESYQDWLRSQGRQSFGGSRSWPITF